MELVITEYMDKTICAWFDGERLVQINTHASGIYYRVGDIFIGKVKNTIKNINAAFVDIGADELCFLQSDDGSMPKREEEIVVQVIRDHIRAKQPVVSSTISIAGRLLVLTEKKGISISGKIKKGSRRKELKELLAAAGADSEAAASDRDVGFIVRTNAEYADDESIVSEKKPLMQAYDTVCKKARTAAAYSKLYQAPPGYIEAVRDSYGSELERIVTDSPRIYDEIKTYVTGYFPEMADKLSLYEDKDYSLNLLYGLMSKIKKALQRKVWLDSGAYIIIDITEACTVIDVNSGKQIKGKKDMQQTFFKTNCEAAREIMLQLRLRNISGIIIIDFIDMISEEHNRELLRYLSGLAAKDPASPVVVGITKLGLVEMTRKKKNKPIYEQFKLTDDEIIVI